MSYPILLTLALIAINTKAQTVMTLTTLSTGIDPHCNQYKGSDLVTFLNTYDDLVPLFNPRKHDWVEHFEAINGEIIPLTRIGQASVKIFRFNEPDLLILRSVLTEVGRYPNY